MAALCTYHERDANCCFLSICHVSGLILGKQYNLVFFFLFFFLLSIHLSSPFLPPRLVWTTVSTKQTQSYDIELCCVLSHSVMFDSATPWSVAHQAPLSMGFSRQQYCSRLSCPPPGDLPNPGIEPRSPALQADSLPSGPPGKHKCSIPEEWKWNISLLTTNGILMVINFKLFKSVEYFFTPNEILPVKLKKKMKKK